MYSPRVRWVGLWIKIVGFRGHYWQIEVIKLSRRELVAIIKLLLVNWIGL